MLILLASGGMKQMFHETGVAVTNPADPIPPFVEEEKQRIIEATPKYGIELKLTQHSKIFD